MSLKIVVCSRQYRPPLVGGVDVYARRLVKALKRLGHEVNVLAVDANKCDSDEPIKVTSDELDGANISRLEFPFASRKKEAFDYAYDPEIGRFILEILQEAKPDLFIIMNFYTVTLAAVESAKSLGIPVIHVATDFLPVCRRFTFIRWNGRTCEPGESIKSCAECFVSDRPTGRAAASLMNLFSQEQVVRWAEIHETYQSFHPFRLLEPYWKQVAIMDKRLKILQPLREQIDLVLTPTQFTRRAFLENGFSEEQVKFLPFGVETDHPMAKVKHTSAENIRFLFVGRLQPYKGTHLLVEAFNKLASPNGATLTIYGTAADGYEDYNNRLQSMMSSNPNIHFKGQIAPSDLGQAFAEADYFVLTSTWHENSPLIILDALQSKTPVITSRIGGVTDMVQDGVNGMLFPMGNAQALKNIMQATIDRPEQVEQLRAGVQLPEIDDYAENMLRLIGVEA